MEIKMTTDTTTLDYWLNWRVLVCAILVLNSMLIALYLIWKYESTNHSGPEQEKIQQGNSRILYADEAWRPCIKHIHPIWLLAYRIIAFSLLLVTLIARVSVSGAGMFFYYTQWTFTLLTVYFGLGSLLSIYGCHQYCKTSREINTNHVERDAEQGHYAPLPNGQNTNTFGLKCMDVQEYSYSSHAAGFCSYVFQILFQMSAGAVMLTDCIYWTVIFPFLTIKDYTLNFMTVNFHTLNIVLLLGDTALNCLRFPWFRISYFVLWTGSFVIFQWIIHACVSIWWPYPFLDLSSSYTPLWYLFVGLIQIPCYGIFALIVRVKEYLLSKWFPHSYQCVR